MRRKSNIAEIDAYPGVVIASDETGYGSWAGPLVVCAVAAPIGWDDHRVKDSKQLTAGERQALYDELLHDPRFLVSISVAEASYIDKIGVFQALLGAHAAVLTGVANAVKVPHIAIIDGTLPVERIAEVNKRRERVWALPKADSLIPECSLASVFAKVKHDQIMAELHAKYPQYGFNENAGYGGDANSFHARALYEHGPCPEHRKSYQPVAEAIAHRDQAGQPNMEDLMALLGE